MCIVGEFRIVLAVGRKVECGGVMCWVTVRCVMPDGGANEALLACWHELMSNANMSDA